MGTGVDADEGRVEPAPLGRLHALFTLIGLGESSLVPFVPLLLRERGLSVQEIGGALGVMAVVGFATGPVWGYVADRWLGGERTLVLSLGGAAALVSGLAFARSAVATVVILTVAWGCRAPNMALIDSIALARLGPTRRRLYGGIRARLSAGWAAGALLWGGVLELAGLDALPLLYTAAAGAVAVYALVGIGARTPLPPIGRLRIGRGLTAMPVLLLFLISLFLVNSAFNATWNFVTIRIATLGGGAFLVGVAACLQAAAEVPTMGATGRLSRHVRPAYLYVIGCAVYLAVFVAWALVANPVAIALFRVVAGVGFGLTYVSAVVIVDDLVPARLRATGQAASKAVANGLAPVAGSFGGGLVYGYAGPATMFVLAAAFAALAGAAAWEAERHPARSLAAQT